jgi:ubiquinone/menaquinone biosynthesis C-methylase UbiE
MTASEKYHPEPYWSEVAERIKAREGKNVIAGDDEPYYRYKRAEFLKMLHAVDFSSRSVLEVGSGPGGNLVEVWKQNPASLTGADISADMVELAKSKVPQDINLVKVDGKKLPFEDDAFQVVFTATVLQHNTDEDMLKGVIREICRVSRDKVYIFEQIDSKIKGDDLMKGRPVSYYADLFKQHGFQLKRTNFINIRVSYYVWGSIRKVFNKPSRV